MFSKDISHYRQTPRSMQTSKFGPYSQLDQLEEKPNYSMVVAFVVVFAVFFTVLACKYA